MSTVGKDTNPGSLRSSQTHYRRVDALNLEGRLIEKGEIWSFTADERLEEKKRQQ